MNNKDKLIEFAKAAGVTGVALEAFIDLLNDALYDAYHAGYFNG